MAGTDSRFDPAAFRTAIKFAMQMGAPEDTTKRVTFRWTTERTFTQADSGGSPLEWSSSPLTEDSPSDVQVDCAVEFGVANPADTSMGQFDVSRGIVTLLDVDYALIFSDGRMADEVYIDGNTYKVQFVGAPLGLFEVTVYQVHIEAVDES